MSNFGLGGPMVATPNIYKLVQGAGEGNMPLNAFDLALLNAGVGDTNLVRMSSIVPPGAEEVGDIVLPKGGLIPIAYATLSSSTPGEVLSAAIAVGIPEDPNEPGVIMEFEDFRPLSYVEATVRQMVIDGFEYRNRKLKSIKSLGVEHTTVKNGSVFAAAVLWYK